MKKQINIEGMSCAHCVRHVEGALKEVSGVGSVQVDLQGKKAIVEVSGTVTDEVLKAAIEEVGYDVTGINVL